MNSFLFLNRFSVSLKSLNNYFLRGFAYKSFLNRFSVLINNIMWSSNHYSTSSCFPRFSGPRFSSFPVFQGPGFPGFRFFNVRVQVLEVAKLKYILGKFYEKVYFICETPADKGVLLSFEKCILKAKWKEMKGMKFLSMSDRDGLRKGSMEMAYGVLTVLSW